MMGSVGSSTCGSAIGSTRASCLPCQVTVVLARSFVGVGKPTPQHAGTEPGINTHATGSETVPAG